MRVTASNAHQTATYATVDVALSVNGLLYEGTATMVDIDGGWAPADHREDHWLSDVLLRDMRDAEEGFLLCEMVDAIAAAAATCCKRVLS